MDPLAAPADVALALGLEDEDSFTAAQTNRVDGLLVRVSRRFRREAEREFTPGTTTLRLITVGGSVHLPDSVEGVDDVTSATMTDCHGDIVELTYTVEGQQLSLERNGYPLPSGIPVSVTYTHTAEVSAEVTADVAAIVARLLTVDPSDSKVKDRQAGPFRESYADWVSDAVLFTEEDCETARSYRYPTPNVIIQRP